MTNRRSRRCTAHSHHFRIDSVIPTEGTASHAPVAHPVTHDNWTRTAGFRAASVSERILSAWLIAIRSLTAAALTDPIFGVVSHTPGAHPVTHENWTRTAGFRAASGSERILSAWLIAIRSLTVAALTEPTFGPASHGPVAHPVTHENRIHSPSSTPIPDPQSPAPIFEADANYGLDLQPGLD